MTPTTFLFSSLFLIPLMVHGETQKTNSGVWKRNFPAMAIIVLVVVGLAFAINSLHAYQQRTIQGNPEDPHNNNSKDRLGGGGSEGKTDGEEIVQTIVSAVEIGLLIVVAVFGICLLYFIFTCIRSACRPDHNSSTQITGDSLAQSQQDNHMAYTPIPVEPKQVDEQVVTVSPGGIRNYHSGEETEDACSICLNPCQGNLSKLGCNHVYHTDCITPWLYARQNCPNCRGDVLVPD